MTRGAAFKREVRARMELTNEPYTEARRKILAELGHESTDREAEADADKVVGLFEQYGTDEGLLTSFDNPDASSGERLPNLEFDGRRWIERMLNS